MLITSSARVTPELDAQRAGEARISFVPVPCELFWRKKSRQMQQIVAATDFSSRSDRAVRRAGVLARQSRAEVRLVHVVDDSAPDPRSSQK